MERRGAENSHAVANARESA